MPSKKSKSNDKYEIASDQNPFATISLLFRNELSKAVELISREGSKTHTIPSILSYVLSRRGKLIRPSLLLASAKIFSNLEEKHFALAAAMESIHNTTLLHDDVVDHADTRRGLMTANKKFGNKKAVLVGDFLFARSMQLVNRADDIRVVKLVSNVCAELVEGEMWGLERLHKMDLDKDNAIKLITKKTASLFSACCIIGATAAGASRQDQNTLGKYGLNFGICYQMIDDLLDYVADEETLGKPVCNDLKEGTITLPFILAYEKAKDNDKKIMKQIFEKGKNITKQDCEDIKKVIQEYDIPKHIFKMARKYAMVGSKALEKVTVESYLLEMMNTAILKSVGREV